MSITLPKWFNKAKHAVHDAGAIVEKKTGIVLNADGVKLPPWVDAAKHVVDSSGILDRETGRRLAIDGHPAAGIARALALAAAGLLSDKLGIVADALIEAAYARLTREAAEKDAAAKAPAGGGDDGEDNVDPEVAAAEPVAHSQEA